MSPYMLPGRRLRGNRGIVSLKKLGGGDRGAFISQYLNMFCRFTLHCKYDKNEREKEDETSNAGTNLKVGEEPARRESEGARKE